MTVGFQAVLVTTQFPVQTAPARIVDIESTHTPSMLVKSTHTKSTHTRNAGYGMDGHVDMMRALSVPSNASG